MNPVEEITLQHAARLLPQRPTGAHKGLFGHVLVLAGAQGFVGAAKLATEGALRSGAGLVTLGVPEPLLDAAAVGLSEAMTAPLPHTDAGTFAPAAATVAARLAAKRDAVVLGPGITTHDGAARFVLGFLACAGRAPLLMDADALNIVAAGGAETRDALRGSSRDILITPHPGEAARLLGIDTAAVQADRPGAASGLLRLGVQCAVLKGQGTFVASAEGRVMRNTTGGHGLAKGGSGDVLAGLLGGLLAQGLPIFDAACLGVFVHGLAGEIAQARMGARAMLARDILAALGEAWQQVEAAA